MKQKNKQQSVEDIFREKLENHQVQADLTDWDIISERIPRKVSNRKEWIQICSTIAASVAVIIISLYMFNQTDKPEYVKEYQDIAQLKERIITTEAEPFIPKQENIQNKALSQTKRVAILPKASPIISTKTDSLLILMEIPKNDKNMQVDLLTDTIEEKDRRPFEVNMLSQQEGELLAYAGKISKKRQKDWIFASSFSTNGIYSDTYSDTEHTSNSDPEPWGTWGGGYLKSTNKENYTEENADINHLPPFSFGLTVRKQLSPRFGVETGIIYTYLSSTYKWHNEEDRYKATQQLHYIGIPIKGTAALWETSKWGTYASVGIMIEKGIRRKINWGNSRQLRSSPLSQDKKIDGIQWSLNSAIGLNYHISKTVGLYIEPQLNYYLKNDQPKSIRTEYPVSVSFGIGLQYSF